MTLESLATEVEKKVPAESIVNTLCELLLSGKKELNGLCEKKTADTVWAWLVEAGRNAWTSQELERRLTNFGANAFGAVVAVVYDKHQRRLISQLNTVQHDFDEIIGADWQVSKAAESSTLGRVNIPKATLSMHILEAGHLNSKQTEVTFDASQFQDFHWKMKEAKNMLSHLRRSQK